MTKWNRLRPEQGGRFADPVGPDPETVAQIRAMTPEMERDRSKPKVDSEVRVGRRYFSGCYEWEIVGLDKSRLSVFVECKANGRQGKVFEHYFLEGFETGTRKWVDENCTRVVE